MIQLKIKTEYTFGQTYAPIPRVIERLKALGCTAAGIVDTNSTWGHVAWFNACRAAGIQPLLGIEAVVSDVDVAHRMWFLAASGAGLTELYRAISKSHHQPITTKKGSIPRLYRRDVLGMSEGIFKFAGDVVDGDFLREARAILDFSPASIILNARKKALDEEGGFSCVSVSDNAYAFEQDKPIMELVSKFGMKQTPQHILSALDHQDFAAHIAAKCDGLTMPTAPMVRAPGSLEAICRQGIINRGMSGGWSEEYETRLKYELELIESKDFSSYFIVVADMVHYAKQHMLVGPSRGSAAGSLVCYLAQITEIDPLPPKLYFERFIDVSRSDLPDIDLDFPDDKRHLVFEYMAEKYGKNNIAHIGTISRYQPKSALVQVCKALNIPPAATGALKVAMIQRNTSDARAGHCLEDTFTTTEPGRAFAKQYPHALVSGKIEGHASHTGVHAAGLLVCNEDIMNYAVVDAQGIAHLEKGAAEKLGLLKIDVLGLRTLGVLEDSGVDIDWYNLPLDDPDALAIFNSGRYCGIFQFEGAAMASLSSLIKFKSIVEIDAATALARPGPLIGGVAYAYIDRMNGKPYEPIHPLVESHMVETYGLPVYQEQTLAIVREIGQFNWEETTSIRKAMSKSLGREYFDQFWPKFHEGARAQGIDTPSARKTWELINTMGSWQMNKAHTYSYAVISYWCAYLKAHHPLEFAAANLRSAKDEDSAVLLLREIAKEGIEFVAFDPALSELNWSVKGGKLIGGFTALKGIGESKAAKLIALREKTGALPAEKTAELLAMPCIFSDIFPMRTKYGHLYDNPRAHGIACEEIVEIASLKEGMVHGAERVFIGELFHKSLRNANEEAEIKKRDGKVEAGQLVFFDFRLRDDSGAIGARIGRRDYLSIGVEMNESVPIGAKLLIRAKFWNGIRYAFVTKWKLLDE